MLSICAVVGWIKKNLFDLVHLLCNFVSLIIHCAILNTLWHCVNEEEFTGLTSVSTAGRYRCLQRHRIAKPLKKLKLPIE